MGLDGSRRLDRSRDSVVVCEQEVRLAEYEPFSGKHINKQESCTTPSGAVQRGVVRKSVVGVDEVRVFDSNRETQASCKASPGMC